MSFRIFLLALCLTSHVWAQTSEESAFASEAWVPFENKRVERIVIHGLIWTRESAVKRLLLVKEGGHFKSEEWLAGLHRLYNTWDIYNISTQLSWIKKDESLQIDLFVTDRWTLWPILNAQGGGGSNTFGLGVNEANLFGQFTYASIYFSQMNGANSYDFTLIQEWLLGSNYKVALDWSQTATPESVAFENGSTYDDYTWVRKQGEVLIGREWAHSNLRTNLTLDFYNDWLASSTKNPQSSPIYRGNQYRIKPTFIWGRSHLTNFLETGTELAAVPAISNAFNEEQRFTQLESSFKFVRIIPPADNIAILLTGGTMAEAPLSYRFHLGGYDSVRGYSMYRMIGSHYIRTSLEYRPRLVTIPLPFFDLDRVVIQGCVFSDSGMMWNVLGSTQGSLTSAGAGIRLNFLRFAGAILRFDWAQTISPNEGIGFSFSAGQFF